MVRQSVCNIKKRTDDRLNGNLCTTESKAMYTMNSVDKIPLVKLHGQGSDCIAVSGIFRLTATECHFCHMESHSVTCHPTQVNLPRLTPARQAGTRFTYTPEGRSAELT